MKNTLVALVLLLGLAPCAHAAAITAGQNITSASAGAIRPAGPGAYSGNLVNETGLAYSNTFLLDMAQYNAREVSAQAVFSTVNYTSPSVSDGSESTASVRVISVTGLSSATATNQVTVATNAFGSLPTLVVQNCSLKMGRDYVRGATRNATATNLAAAIQACVPAISATASGNVIYATAAYGSYANAYAFTSDNSSITVASALMTGGADNACLTINGTALCNNSSWYAGASTTTAVLSLGNAIANAGLSLSTKAAGVTGIIYTTSTLNGTAYNYTLASSSPTVLSVSQAVFSNGTNSGFTLNSQKLVASAASGLTLGLPVLYAVGSNPALGGLTTGTTYFAVPYSATGFYLAKYSSSAVAGLSSDYVTVTSTASGTTNHTYPFVPLAWSGSATYLWQTSNDNSNWSTAPSTGTVTITSSTTNSPLSINWGVLGYRYLRLNFTAQTTGGLSLVVPVYLKQD